MIKQGSCQATERGCSRDYRKLRTVKVRERKYLYSGLEGKEVQCKYSNKRTSMTSKLYSCSGSTKQSSTIMRIKNKKSLAKSLPICVLSSVLSVAKEPLWQNMSYMKLVTKGWSPDGK